MMIAKLTVLTIGVIAALSCASSVQAANCATISVSPGTPSIPAWNPINPAAQEATFAVTVTRVSSTTKSLRLIFLDADSNATPVRIGPTAGPRYQLLNTDSGATISFPSGTQVASQTVPNTQFGNGANNSVIVNMKVQILANSSPSE